MGDNWSEVDTFLRTSPLAFIALTLVAYRIGLEVRRLTGGHAVAQPVLIAIVIVGAVLVAADIDYATYRPGVEVIAVFLGPATVALAVPLHRQVRRLRGFVVPLCAGVVVSAAASILVGTWVVHGWGGSEVLSDTIAPRAATTPVALALVDEHGGIAPLAAVLVIVSGIVGAVLGPRVLTWLRVRDPRARGLAMGASAHGIGTSRALAESETEGAFSGLAMGLTALAISLLLPLLGWLNLLP